MKKIIAATLLAAVIAVQVVCLTGCGGWSTDPMYDKTYELTGKAMPITWNEQHGLTFSDEDDMYSDTREVLEKYFDKVDWNLTKENFAAEGMHPIITLTDEATKSVDAFISFMDKAAENIYENLKGFKFKVGSEADEVDITITYPNGESQTVKTKNGGVQDPQEFRGINFSKEGANDTEIFLGLSRTGDKGTALNLLLSDEFTTEQLGSSVDTSLYYTLLDKDGKSLMDIRIYPEYTVTENA